MAHCISENMYRDLWKEVHKVRSKSRVSSQCMDDVTGNENITQLFAHKYDVLCNSVCSNSDEMSNILYMNQADIESVCLDNDSHKMINKQARVQEFARGGAQSLKPFFFLLFNFSGGGPSLETSRENDNFD